MEMGIILIILIFCMGLRLHVPTELALENKESISRPAFKSFLIMYVESQNVKIKLLFKGFFIFLSGVPFIRKAKG
jgi:hypothetical protein